MERRTLARFRGSEGDYQRFVEEDLEKDGVTHRLLQQKLPGGRRKVMLIRRSGGREYEDRVLDGSGPMSAGSRAASTVFGLACGVLALVSILETSPSSVPGWFGVLILAMGGFHFLRMGLSSRPRFEITEDGFIDRRFIGGGELHLEWDEIRDVRLARFGGQLEVFVRDPAAVRARAGWPRKLWMHLGALYGKNSYSIHPWYVGPNLVELRRFMERRMLELERSRIGLSAASEQSPGLPSTGGNAKGQKE